MKLFLVSLFLLVGIASAQLPSDLITYQNASTVLDLQHVSPNAAKSIDQLNAELSAFQLRDMVDLGHYSSSTREETQGSNETQTAAVRAFVGGEVAPLVDVGNVTGNVTEINGTMVWL